MEKWAERIKSLLDQGRHRGLTQTGLAKACGISQPSVSQWFNDGAAKPATEMIRGDNLIAAARYLGTTPEWVMTGSGPSTASQPATLDLGKLQIAIVSVKEAVRRAGLEIDAFVVAPMIAFAYRETASLPASAKAEDFRAFDELVWQRLSREIGHGERPRRAVEDGAGGDEKAPSRKAKAGRRGA